jgi:hypothetical protein
MIPGAGIEADLQVCGETKRCKQKKIKYYELIYNETELKEKTSSNRSSAAYVGV